MNNSTKNISAALVAAAAVMSVASPALSVEASKKLSIHARYSCEAVIAGMSREEALGYWWRPTFGRVDHGVEFNSLYPQQQYEVIGFGLNCVTGEESTIVRVVD